MTATSTTIEQPAGGGLTWYALSAQEVTAQMGVDADTGLTVAEVERRQAEYGPNELPTEPPPSVWVVAREQLMNPMNIMLLIVARPASPSSRSPPPWWCWVWCCSTW